MKTEQKIISYLHHISKGIINLTTEQAADIVKIAAPAQIVNKITGVAYARFSQWNGQLNSYDVVKVITTTDSLINSRIKEALDKGPVEGFYKYDLYNMAGDYEGHIFSADNNLF